MTDWKDLEYMTVTLVVGYDPKTQTSPDEWDWSLLAGEKSAVIEAWATESDELEKSGIPIPTCDLCGKPQDADWQNSMLAPDDWNGETGCHFSCELAGT